MLTSPTSLRVKDGFQAAGTMLKTGPRRLVTQPGPRSPQKEQATVPHDGDHSLGSGRSPAGTTVPAAGTKPPDSGSSPDFSPRTWKRATSRGISVV